MKPIDPVMIKQAVKEGQLTFYVKEQDNVILIYAKDTTTEECVCVGKQEESEE